MGSSALRAKDDRPSLCTSICLHSTARKRFRSGTIHCCAISPQAPLQSEEGCPKGGVRYRPSLDSGDIYCHFVRMRKHSYSFKNDPPRLHSFGTFQLAMGWLLDHRKIRTLRRLVRIRQIKRRDASVENLYSYLNSRGSADEHYVSLLVGIDVRASAFLRPYTDTYMYGLVESLEVLNAEPSDDPRIERLMIRVNLTNDWCCTADIWLYYDADPWFDPTEVISMKWGPREEG